MGVFDSIIFVEFDHVRALYYFQIQKNPKKLVYETTVQSLFVCLFVFNIFPSNLTHFLLSRGGRQDIYQKTSITIVLSLLGNCGILNKNV